MGKLINRTHNERFFDEYAYFDQVLAERFNIESGGVEHYIKKMKECVVEARDVIPEFDTTLARFLKMKDRYSKLDEGHTSFEEFQGKDEDVVWISVFMQKLDADADPLSKYAKIDFKKKKTKNKSFMDKLKGALKK